MKTTSLTILENDDKSVEVSCKIKGVEITIYTSSDELSSLYQIQPAAISYEWVKTVVIDNKLKIVKKHLFDADVEEWLNGEKTLSFKKEAGLIVVVDRDHPEDVVYLKPYELTTYGYFGLTRQGFQVIKKHKDKKKLKDISLNIENLPDLSGYNPCN